MIDKLIALLAHTRRTSGERGASAVEYGLLVAGIAALVVVAVFALGPLINEAFTDTCDEIEGSGTIAATC
ncbi:Flp family type IVb pilin [Nocardioides sp. AX2bis]|uniref:Flp family type IVb pilin n=1 Tax=Nocardioides sp. AX2bis TaxID=2653157 RepID=UPI0012EF6AEF|nr:Flp family type IVb pilin [Nocardioides sp. AX2bis]VXB73171.1 Pilus assembly protein Flp/PilA [Nocardioides sp. AX2bis]